MANLVRSIPVRSSSLGQNLFGSLTNRRAIQRPLLGNALPVSLAGQNARSFTAWPSVPFLGKSSLLFTADSIKKNTAVIPVLAICIVGLTCELLYIIRLAFTRDDVKYNRNSMAPCEYVEIKKNKPIQIRKFVTINQKYENSDELIEAYIAVHPELEKQKCKEKK